MPYNDEAKRLRKRLLRGGEIDFVALRGAQRYTVGLRGERKEAGSIDPKSPLGRLVEAGVVEDHPSGLFILHNDAAYSNEKGLSFDAAGFGPESLMA